VTPNVISNVLTSSNKKDTVLARANFESFFGSEGTSFRSPKLVPLKVELPSVLSLRSISVSEDTCALENPLVVTNSLCPCAPVSRATMENAKDCTIAGLLVADSTRANCS